MVLIWRQNEQLFIGGVGLLINNRKLSEPPVKCVDIGDLQVEERGKNDGMSWKSD